MAEDIKLIQEVTFRDYLRVFFRRKKVVIITFITVMVSVIIGLQFFTPTYEGRVKMVITGEKTLESPYYRQLMGYQSVQAATTQSEVIKSDAVLERAIWALKLYERPEDYEKQFCSPIKAPFVDLKVKIFAILNRLLNPEFDKMTPEQKISYKVREIIADLKLSIMAIEPVLNTNVFNLIVTDYSPLGAAITANAISRSYIIFDLEQQLAEAQLKYGEKHPMTIHLRDNITAMLKNLNGRPLSNVEAVGPASIKIVEQASPAIEPVFSLFLVILTIALSFFVAIFLGVALAFVLEYMDQTFKSSRDIEGFLNLPFLGSIPCLKKKSKDKTLIKDTGKVTPYTQSYQNLSDQIHLLLSGKNQKSLLVTSALISDGANIIVANLGTYLSHKAGHKALIIDADLREPSMHELFNISNETGLAEVLEGRVSFEKAVQKEGHNLEILTAGKTMLNPLILLGSVKFSELIKIAKEKYMVVLVNCANLRNYMDAVVLSSSVDAVVLAIKEGKTSRHVVKYAILPLLQKKVNLIGAILTDRTFPIPEKIYKST